MNTDHSQAIVSRFFDVLNALHASKELRFMTNFTGKHDIDRRTFHISEKDPSSNRFQVAWLVYLIDDYGVSPTLLLTGKDPAVSRAFLDLINSPVKPRRSEKGTKNPITDDPAPDIADFKKKHKKAIAALTKNPDGPFPMELLIELGGYGVGVSGVLRGGEK